MKELLCSSVTKYLAMDIRRSAMAQKLFSTGPGIFKAERKETIDSLDRNVSESVYRQYIQCSDKF